MKQDELLTHYLNHPMHQGLSLNVSLTNGTATLSIIAHKEICNLVGTLHGSYYFKMMDDACFFAALSLKKHHFVATANFNINYLFFFLCLFARNLFLRL